MMSVTNSMSSMRRAKTLREELKSGVDDVGRLGHASLDAPAS